MSIHSPTPIRNKQAIDACTNCPQHPNRQDALKQMGISQMMMMSQRTRKKGLSW